MVKKYFRYRKLKNTDMDVLNSDLQKLSFPTESLDSMVQRYKAGKQLGLIVISGMQKS